VREHGRREVSQREEGAAAEEVEVVWKPWSWSECFCEVLGAAFEFGAAGELGEEFFERAGVVGGDEFIGFSVQKDFAFVDDDDAMADAFDDVENVGAVDDGFAFTGEGLDEGFEADGGVGVEAVEGFIEENDGGIVEKRGGDDDFAAHAFGVSAEEFFGEGLEAEIEEGDELLDAFARGIGRDAVEGGDHFEVFEAGEGFEDCAGIGDEADAFFDFEGVAEQVEAADGGGAAGGFEHSGEHFKSGGFAGAVGAEEADDLAGRDFEGDGVDGDLCAEVLGETIEGDHPGDSFGGCDDVGVHYYCTVRVGGMTNEEMS